MWTRHLSRDALLAVAEGRATAEQAAHAASCEGCERDAEALRSTLVAIRRVDVPEPSPLFWDHLSARIGEAIARDETPTGGTTPWPGAARRWALWFAGTGAAVALAVALTWQGVDRTTRTVSTPEAVDAIGTDSASADQGNGDWEFLVSLVGADDVESSDDGVGSVQPGTADRAVLAMTDAERTALVDLLETELRQPSS